MAIVIGRAASPANRHGARNKHTVTPPSTSTINQLSGRLAITETAPGRAETVDPTPTINAMPSAASRQKNPSMPIGIVIRARMITGITHSPMTGIAARFAGKE